MGGCGVGGATGGIDGPVGVIVGSALGPGEPTGLGGVTPDDALAAVTAAPAPHMHAAAIAVANIARFFLLFTNFSPTLLTNSR